MFNDYAKMLEILRWMATQIPGDRVLVFLSSWDGRYYWDYPNYQVPERMGGEAGFRRLIKEGQKLGFKMMPMFGANAANRTQPKNYLHFSLILGYKHVALTAPQYFPDYSGKES